MENWRIGMEEDKNNHAKVYELLIQASHELQRILEIEDVSLVISVSNANDPRKYYLNNVLNEVDKSIFSVMFANDFLLANQNKPSSKKNDRILNSKIIQTKIDELSLWRRKLVEILVDLIGFRRANSLDYYRHYNILYETARKQKELKDREEFWGCSNQSLKEEIQELQVLSKQLEKKLDSQKCWYAEKKKKTKELQLKLNGTKNRFLEILGYAKKYQKALLLSYRHSFGLPSELMHPNRIFDEKNKTFIDLDYAVRFVSILSLHVISAIKDLLRVHNVKGSLKQVADGIKKNSYPVFLFNLRTKSNILINDFVATPFGPAQIIKIFKTKFGYRAFRVKYLISSMSNEGIEEYISEEIQLLASYKWIKKEVLRILHEANPKIKVSTRGINKALKNQVLELWAFTKGKMT
ncbi:MAG: hypothetical protein K1060chlam4_00096 [Candidatus Anoxychlamydiales bacterium]|nr:hypothetical protein [Candidatus Anoxychlamydiales bacterium]